jgi:hypothetical protein
MLEDLTKAYLPFVLRAWNDLFAFLQELLIRNNSVTGKVKDIFYRFDFQGVNSKDNKPQAGTTSEEESQSMSTDRICCSSTELASRLYGNDYATLLELVVFSYEDNFNNWVDILYFHIVTRTTACKRMVGA